MIVYNENTYHIHLLAPKLWSGQTSCLERISMGTLTIIRVPSPTRDQISIHPPILSARSRIPIKTKVCSRFLCNAGQVEPGPIVRDFHVQIMRAPGNPMNTDLAAACASMLLSASCAMRNIATSVSGLNRRGVPSTRKFARDA